MSESERPASEEAIDSPSSSFGGGPSNDGGGGPPSMGGEGIEPAKPAKRRGRGSGSFLRELPVLLLVAFVLAFLLRTFVVQVFYIPSSSMEPTLQINDRMVVEKVTYRFRDPHRGEVAVFEGDELGVSEDQNGVQRVVRGVGQFIGLVPASARDFVKRVVGLPGDEILIEDGVVFVNGEPLEEPYVVHDDHSDFGPVTVPEDRLFFLGDNRPNSSDSRRSLGFVPVDHLVGRAAVIIWPFDHGGMLTGTVHEVPDRGEAREPDVADTEDGDAAPPRDDDSAMSDDPAPRGETTPDPQREAEPSF